MKCWVYKGSKRPDTYIYLDRADDFSQLPDGLTAAFGTLELAMELDLSSIKKLAREDISQVRKALTEKGFYIQLPPGSQSLIQTLNNQK